MQKLIALFGPTASGKTDIAVRLAQKFNGYIISADSRQMYLEFTIGTSKPLDYPHYFVDFLNPQETYSAGEFKHDVLRLIQEKKGLPILVGGTPLYVSTLTQNLTIPPAEPDYALREKLDATPLEELVSQLSEIDPKSLTFIDIKNKRRVIRALEVHAVTGVPFSQQRKKSPPLYSLLPLFLNPPLDELQKRISQRTSLMLSHGLIDEVRELRTKYPSTSPPFSSIGYKEVVSFLEGTLPQENLEAKICHETLAYAKRQIAWFKKENGNEIQTYKDAEALVSQFINNET